jgi:hypothetical protein
VVEAMRGEGVEEGSRRGSSVHQPSDNKADKQFSSEYKIVFFLETITGYVCSAVIPKSFAQYICQ